MYFVHTCSIFRRAHKHHYNMKSTKPTMFVDAVDVVDVLLRVLQQHPPPEDNTYTNTHPTERPTCSLKQLELHCAHKCCQYKSTWVCVGTAGPSNASTTHSIFVMYVGMCIRTTILSYVHFIAAACEFGIVICYTTQTRHVRLHHFYIFTLYLYIFIRS